MSPVPVEAEINIKNAVANKAVEAILKKISMAFEKLRIRGEQIRKERFHLLTFPLGTKVPFYL
jgi:hypothetical protein